MGQMLIHIIDIGPVLWPRNEVGPWGWCVPLSTSGPRPNRKGSRKEKMPITVKEVVSMLRTGVDLAEAHNAGVRLCRVGPPRILEVIGETEYPVLIRYERRSLLTKVDRVNPTALATTHINARDPTGN